MGWSLPMRAGVVFIAEDSELDPNVPGRDWFTARFNAHWESDDGQEFRNGPEGVSADEAIKWGREQADVVLIRVGNWDLGGADHGYFSAGVEHPDDEELPLWPDGMDIPRRLVTPVDQY
jgi:hypothetical protein